MPVFNAKLNKKEEVANGTIAFYFEKPESFKYQAGQHINVTLIDPPETDDEGTTRIFSLASAPYEKDLMVATRIRETAFKKIFKNIVPGNEVEVYGPSGNFILHKDGSRPAVFLAGGIGITPFFSMIKQGLNDKLAQKFFLFYSNRKPEDAAFLEGLKELEKENKKFKLIATMTEMDKLDSSWKGDLGYIDEKMLKKYISSLKSPIYYIAGPPPMTMAMQKMLESAGIEAESIHYENFFGY